MPIYLCKPGKGSEEPWRHGVQVYACPFPLNEYLIPSSSLPNSPSPSLKPTTNSKNHYPLHNNIGGEGDELDEEEEEERDQERKRNSHVVINPTTATTAIYVNHQQQDQDNTTNANASNNINSDDRTIRHCNTSSSQQQNRSLTHGVSSMTQQQQQQQGGYPIRRIRHAEIVLVDQVSICYNRYWFRLRWPGMKGGIAGYIALGLVPTSAVANVLPPSVAVLEKIHHHLTTTTTTTNTPTTPEQQQRMLQRVQQYSPTTMTHDISNNRSDLHDNHNHMDEINHQHDFLVPQPHEEEQEEYDALNNDECLDQSSNRNHEHSTDDNEMNDDDDDEEEEDEEEDGPRSRTGSIPSKPSYNLLPICSSSGLYFPTSPAMELLLAYDDGLTHPMTTRGEAGDDCDLSSRGGEEGGEPVFCRICREGLHDVNYDTAAIESLPEEGGGGVVAPSTFFSSSSSQIQHPLTRPSKTNPYTVEGDDNLDHKSNLILNHPYAENPLLAPCECSGSMAFVHYLCVEQWRCRSDHPIAKNGLCCETCGSPYLLPPPPTRPLAHAGGGVGGPDDDFLQAIPPHVIQALRRPHFFWKIGAAVVRRKWLRVITPVLVSPLVSLYCRARRMLKKRGVSRRRWACSLCRRRARWKCVRCLRSYYCSRQCQNVSWHIVHKHVCYKPARFWWSVIVYGAATFLFVPGILKHPVIYDWGLSMLTISFVIMAVVGGGFAVVVKRLLKVDIRGRGLELGVVMSSLWLARKSWGLVWAYFGDSSMCRGYPIPFMSSKAESITLFHPVVMTLRFLLFLPGQSLIYFVDKMLLNSRPFMRQFLCAETNTCEHITDAQICVPHRTTCFRTTKAVNPDFYRPQHAGNASCAADMDIVLFFWLLAASIILVGALANRRERQRRLLARERLHMD